MGRRHLSEDSSVLGRVQLSHCSGIAGPWATAGWVVECAGLKPLHAGGRAQVSTEAHADLPSWWESSAIWPQDSCRAHHWDESQEPKGHIRKWTEMTDHSPRPEGLGVGILGCRLKTTPSDMFRET